MRDNMNYLNDIDEYALCHFCNRHAFDIFSHFFRIYNDLERIQERLGILSKSITKATQLQQEAAWHVKGNFVCCAVCRSYVSCKDVKEHYVSIENGNMM